MFETRFRFEFDPIIDLEDAEMSLHLALLAVDGLYGEARVRLESSYKTDNKENALLLEGSAEVGDAIVKVYTGLLMHEFGGSKFKVSPLSPVAREQLGPNT